MATIVVFASSLFITSILVLFKAVELRYQKKNILLSQICKFDDQAVNLAQNIKFRIFQLIQTIRYVLIVKSKEIFRNTIIEMEARIVHEYKSRQKSLMGRKDILNRGAVSFYLKKIAEDKINNEKGKIEESVSVH